MVGDEGFAQEIRYKIKEMKSLKESMMGNMKDNLCAYADYLENNNCEFFILAHNKDDDKTTALVSENATEMLSAVFEKSPQVHNVFKQAEHMMDHQQSFISLN